jgi:TonB-dependent SusC/RagA subfamily outer membrane receptor
VSVNRPDISQIEKYLNGELDARAMHELERQALDDPFLADALEGYAQKPVSAAAHLKDLNRRLHQRIQPKTKRLSLLSTLSIAATVLVFVSIGSWYWFIYQPSASVKNVSPADKTEVAKTQPLPTIKPIPVIVQPELKPAAAQWSATKPGLKSSRAKGNLLADVKPDSSDAILADLTKVKADTGNNALQGRANLMAANANSKQKRDIHYNPQLNEVVVVGYGTQQKRSVTSASMASVKLQSIDSALGGRVTGLSVAAADVSARSSKGIQIRGMSTINKDQQPLYIVDGKVVDKIDNINSNSIASINILKDSSAKAIYGSRAANGVVIIKTKMPGLINGQVVSATDHLPIPGVMVKVKGSSKAVVTNADGKFTVNADKDAELVFLYVGFDTRELKVKGSDSLKVALTEDRRSLSEVVVTGQARASGQQRASTSSLDEAITSNRKVKLLEDKKAHPLKGWKDFNNYLKDKAQSPDGKTGVVRVSFIVNPNNTITDIKVTKSLSTEADVRAAEIIKDYQGWVSNTDGTAETVKVRIRFNK